MVQAIDDQKIGRLWGHLSNQFNVVVHGIWTGMDSNKGRQAVVIVDGKTDEAVIKTLPTTFEGENVVYEKGGQPSIHNW